MELGRAQLLRRWVGAALGLASVAYFLAELFRRWPEIRALPWTSEVVGALGGALTLQFASALLDAWFWARLLRAMGIDAPVRDAVSVFGISQFAKYVPGNVAQHLGRVAEARAKGWQTGRVVLSLFIENGFALGSGALLAAVSVIGMTEGDAWQTPRAFTALLALVTGSIAGAVVLQRILANPPARVRSLLSMEEAIDLRSSFLLSYLGVHLVSYVAIGSGLALILRGIVGSWPPGVWRVPAAVAASWLAGYLVPGAPAGLGVREATLTALLGPTLGTGVVVTAALLWRLAALLTDVATLLVGLGLRRRETGAV